MDSIRKEKFVAWLRQPMPLRGALLRALRFSDESFVTEGEAPGFTATGLEQVWRLVVDTFEVLHAQRIPPTRLSWLHEKAVLHCARRADGTILAVFLPRKNPDADPMAFEKLINDFQSFDLS